MSGANAIDDSAGDDPVLHELTAEGARKQAGEWTLTLYRDRMRVAKDGEVFVYERARIVGKADVMAFLGGDKIVLVLDGWKTGLSLDLEATHTLRRWMGSDLGEWEKAQALKNTRASILGGLAGVATGLWLGGWFLLAYGLASVALGIGRRVRPGRWLFLAGAARSVVVGVVLLVDILRGVASTWWGLILVLLLFPTSGAIAKHRFFAPVAPEE